MQENDISKEVQKYTQSYIQSQKDILKEKTTTLIKSISYYDQKITDQMTSDLKSFVKASANIADNIYHNTHSKKIMLGALKNVKLAPYRGNLFVMDTSGYVYQHFDKTLEHRNILHVKDMYDIAFVKDFNRLIRYEGEGFIGYSWYKPGYRRDRMYDKLAYVKKISCNSLYIGAGLYIDEVQDSVKEDILKFIGANARFDNGFFFILDYHQNIVYCPEDHVSSSLKQYAKNGSFVQENEIFYSQYIEKYNWYIVGEKSLTNRALGVREGRYAQAHKIHNVKKDLMLLGIALVVSMFLSLYLSYIIYKRFRLYEEQINDSHEKMMFRTKQALIGELFSMIAHQWRQPINKIASIVALMRVELGDEKCTKKQLDNSCEEIEESIEYMSETIEDFRTFYKPTTVLKVVNLKELIERSVTFLNNALEKKDIQVIQKLTDDIEIKLYRNEFLQVMLNLIKNAIDATDQGGMITLRLYRHGKRIIIAVENSGTPISQEVMQKIFQPYFTTKKDSMGLGLYMTKIIVEKHMRGEILIERLSEGTKFLIIL